MEVASLSPGAVLAGRRLEERLGHGGEGEVWRASRPDGSSCALKVVRPDVLPAPEETRRRGRWLVRIDHPALVKVARGGRFTAGELAGWGFVEMDLVLGEPLPRHEPEAVALLAPVAEALDRLHAGTWSDGVPLVHRDVKPANLVRTDHGVVLVDPSTMRGLDTVDLTRVGTPAYVAPEVATGRFGPLADVYSFAVTVAGLLTGRRGSGLTEVVRDPLAFGLPDGVVAGMAADPADRPPTCTAVLRHGGAAVTGSGREGRPAGWPVAALALVVGAPAVVRALTTPGQVWSWEEPLGVAVAAACAVHLVLHVATGRVAVGLLAPPWAWGDLIAGLRDPDDDRARWLADVVAGVIVAGVGTGLWFGDQTSLGRWLPVALTGAGVGLVVLARRAARVGGRALWALIRLIASPVRVVGGLPRAVVTGGRR